MADRITANRWLFGAAYFGLMCVIILWHILPIELGPTGYPGPDIPICITMVWVLRRPQYLPAPLIALVFLITDLLFLRPPGLWTAIVVLGVEFLRARAATSRDLPFPVEWAMVSAVLVAMHVANRVVLSALLVPQTGFGLVVLQVLATILAYPLIVLLSRLVFGIEAMSPAEVDEMERRR